MRQHLLRQSNDTPAIDITEALAELTIPPGEEPPEILDNSQRLEQFQKDILDRLPPRVGAALVLHRVHGCSVQETANQMGIARETVKQYLADAAKRCRKTE